MIELLKRCIEAWRESDWMPYRLVIGIDPASPDGSYSTVISWQDGKVIHFGVLTGNTTVS